MKYGREYDVGRLTNAQHEIVELLIRRELTAPSSPYNTFYNVDPDGDDLRGFARSILMGPSSRREEALRADCIHASFGVLDWVLKNKTRLAGLKHG